MREIINSYRIEDDDGDKATITIINRICGCNSPGCVDDEIQVIDDLDEDGNPFIMQVPRLMTPYIEGLLDGSCKVIGKIDTKVTK